jgi:hypothetical protein
MLGYASLFFWGKPLQTLALNNNLSRSSPKMEERIDPPASVEASLRASRDAALRRMDAAKCRADPSQLEFFSHL